MTIVAIILRKLPKLDMPGAMIRQFAPNPKECVFALTTQTLSADLKTRVLPCQYGGNPDCSSCGCVASMGLAAVVALRLGGVIPVGLIFKASIKIGQARSKRSVPARELKSNCEFCLSDDEERRVCWNTRQRSAV